MNTSLGVLTAEFATIVENTSGCSLWVNTLVLSAVDAAGAVADLRIKRGSQNVSLLASMEIPEGKSLITFLSKDLGVALEPGDRLEGRCTPSQSAHFVCSYGWPEACPSSSSSSMGEIMYDCSCFKWNCETSACDLILVGCPDFSDPCYENNNCCSVHLGHLGYMDECVNDGSCGPSSSSSDISLSSSSSSSSSDISLSSSSSGGASSSSSDISLSSSSSGGPCASCSKEWDPGNCVPITVDASRLVYVDDGNLPSPCAPSGNVTIYMPKQLTMKVTTPCFADITTRFRYREGSTNQWTRIYNPLPEWQGEYDADPTSDYLLFNSSLALSNLQGFQIYGYELLPEDNWNTEDWPNTIINGHARFKVRYRREYGDYTFVSAYGASSTRQSCSGCDCSEVAARTPSGSGPSTPNSDLYNSYGSSGFYLGSCANYTELLDNITVEITGEETCRQPLPGSDCTACVNSPSVDYTTLPSHPGYFAGCTGRPIDIDVDSCDATVRPTSFTKNNFVLYYQGGPNQPFMVIDNVAYDPRAAGLIKVFTTSDPESMRDMVCSRLRFATLVDETKLSTDIGAALDSNWPYNDLYWYSACGNLPSEVPINLVPC